MESKMDFHSLSRKELQTLCKKNKIPANLTNLAMADALNALENVEGLDEIISALTSDSQPSPKRTVPGSPDIPRTAGRTSIRRRNANIEPESSQHLTRRRRTTKGAVAEETSPENINFNLLETPAISSTRRRKPAASALPNAGNQLMEEAGEEKHVEKENNDAPETPAMQSCHRRAPVTSTRKKMEAQREENSVQRVYGTRKSARLLEKNMAKLSLMEKLRVERVKIDGLSNEMEDVKEKPDVPGADPLMLSIESLDKPNDSEVPSFGNLDHALNNESETTQEFKEDKKSNGSEVDDCHVNGDTGSEKCDNLEDVSTTHEFKEDNKSNGSEVDDCHMNAGTGSEKCDNLDDVSTTHEFKEDKESNDSEVDDCHMNAGTGSEKCDNLDDVSTTHEFKEDKESNDSEVDDCHMNADTRSEKCDNLDDVSRSQAQDVVNISTSIKSDLEVEHLENAVDVKHEALDVNGENEALNSDRESVERDLNRILHFLITEASYDGSVCVIGSEKRISSVKVPDEDFAKAVEQIISEAFLPQETISEVNNVESTVSDSLTTKGSELLDKSSNINLTEDEQLCDRDFQTEFAIQDGCDEIKSVQVQQNDNKVVVQNDFLLPPENFHLEQSESRNEPESPKTVSEIPSTEVQENDYNVTVHNNDPLLPEKLHLEQSASIKEPESPKTVSEHEISNEVSANLVSQSCISNILPDLSPINVMESSKMQELSEVSDDYLRSTPVSGGKVTDEMAFLPFAADTLQGQFPRQTETTRRKSSTKSLPTTQRMTHASDINKENINSGWKIETEQEKQKKIVTGQEAALGDMSLRTLTKMLKEKLQIANKKNEEDTATKVVDETRMALRTLTDNCMLSATVLENQNYDVFFLPERHEE